MKKVLMGALAIFASLALFSCGGDDDDEEDTSSKIINIDIKDATENVTIAKETLADGYKVTFSYDSSTFTETTEGFKAKIVFADGAEGVNFVDGEEVAPVAGNNDFVAVEGEANTYWVEFDYAPNGAEMPVTFRKEGALDTVVTIKFVDTNPAAPTVANPVISSPAAGEVAAGTPVVITCETENAMIGYWFGDGSIETSELYDAEHPFVLTESGVLHVQAVLFDGVDPVAFSQVVTVEYTVAAAARVQPVPYAETKSGAVEYKARLRFYADMVEGSGEKDAAVYWQYVAEGEEATLNAENYSDTSVATKYSGSIGSEEYPSGGAYYCIAVGTDGIVSEIVSFSYTYEVPAGLSAGLEAAATRIAAATHVTDNLPTADIKDGLVVDVTDYIVTDADGLDKLAELVTTGNSFEGYTFTQTADITFNESVNGEDFVAPVEAAAGTPAAGLRTFAGIGDGSNAFAGTYDGNGYKISGMYIYEDHANLGFVCLSTATTVLKNINFYDVSVVLAATTGDTDNRCGGILGKAGGDTTIQNCVFVGTVGSAEAATRNTTEYFSADIGDANKTASTIADCLFVAKITAKQSTGIKCVKNQANLDYTNVVTYDASIE